MPLQHMSALHFIKRKLLDTSSAKWWLVAFFVVLVALFVYHEGFHEVRYNNRLEKKIQNAFDKQHFKPEVFKYKEKIVAFVAFLQKHAETLMSYKTHRKPIYIELENGGGFLYTKEPDTFHFYNEKVFYRYIPKNLRSDIKTYFDHFDGLITGFTIQSPTMGESLDMHKPNILLRIKKDNGRYSDYISHAIYFNKKEPSAGFTASDKKRILVKETPLRAGTRYTISAFLDSIKD